MATESATIRDAHVVLRDSLIERVENQIDVGRQAHGASGRRFRQGDGATESPGSWGQGRG